MSFFALCFSGGSRLDTRGCTRADTQDTPDIFVDCPLSDEMTAGIDCIPEAANDEDGVRSKDPINKGASRPVY